MNQSSITIKDRLLARLALLQLRRSAKADEQSDIDALLGNRDMFDAFVSASKSEHDSLSGGPLLNLLQMILANPAAFIALVQMIIGLFTPKPVPVPVPPVTT